MFRLASFLFAIVGTTLAGSFMIAGLVMGFDTLVPIVVAVGLGFAAAVPVSVLIARAIMQHNNKA